MIPLDPHHQAIVSAVDLDARRRVAADRRQARIEPGRPRRFLRRAFDR